MTEPVTVLSHVPLPLLGAVRERFPDVALVSIPEVGLLEPGVRGDVLLTQAWGSPNLAAVMERGVRWVHGYGTGVNDFPFEALGGVPLTCSRGASGIPIAEWVLAAMLAFEKRFPESFVQTPEEWKISGLGGLYGRTLALIGFGGIGQAVAQRALPFGMRVLAKRRSGGASPVEGVTLAGSWKELLGEADHVVVAAPATPETHHLVGRERFAEMKPGAHLVNVARGALVDQEALREALDAGRVAAATLDVAEPEPPPAGHWLYTHPRVRLSPHISWSMPGALALLLDPFLENLARFRDGAELLARDRVDLARGY
ncbi:MAG: NAD(P)-dependent oxidoreductase [Myxococcota bacterium]